MSGSARARLFVALELPLSVREELARWARRAPGGRHRVRVLDPDALHVTLCFLGSRSLDELDDIGALVTACAREPDAPALGELGLGAPVWLPPRQPRVLAIELHDDDGALGELQGRLSAALAGALDWEPERRRYRPHVTVARMPAGGAPRARELPPTPPLRFAPVAVTVFRSFLQRSGAVYEPLLRVEV